jgi:hypothetical protein
VALTMLFKCMQILLLMIWVSRYYIFVLDLIVHNLMMDQGFTVDKNLIIFPTERFESIHKLCYSTKNPNPQLSIFKCLHFSLIILSL